MKIDQSLDTLTTISHQYIKNNAKGLTFEHTYFSGFKPEQASTQIVASLYGQTYNNEWYYTTIVIDRTDLLFIHNTGLAELTKQRLDTAIQMLQDFAEDPFYRWVKEVRRENGGRIQDPDRSADEL